ncbi:MAG TPA: M20/M25/M40 family metallo-hydrolase [Rudaea sp.]|jgi:acetylornithine deacetylase/succinyl-diaminopimelate desuccinylase-like protein|uniref:M20/M25/M40 family metallo-hydrolase n=1 Tax=Rudaea sp. TaxID=2136325 RepID=UPI002F92A612
MTRSKLATGTNSQTIRCLPRRGIVLAVFGAIAFNVQATSAPNPLARAIFKQLIEINTTDSVGDTTIAAKAMQKRLLDAGFAAQDAQVLVGPNPKRGNLVARLHGNGKHKPVLIIGHLDVVEAKREDWTTDPFVFTEKGGYWYGRGTQDMKSADAIAMAALIRFKKEGFVPDRDIVLALTADEEGGTDNGVDWLLKNHRDLIDAEFALNPDSGGVDADAAKPVLMNVEATEKLYADFELTATNPGGHSSLPRPDNAIYELTGALNHLQATPFPFELNAVTRAWLEHMQTIEDGTRSRDIKAVLATPPDADAIARLSQDPRYNSTLHTTCVTTLLAAGHANNALPQRATANVNCRILPGHSPEEVRQDLIHIFNEPKLSVRYVDPATAKPLDKAPDKKAMTPPPPRKDVFDALHAVVGKMWPGIPIVPEMETGASDSIYTMAAGIPSYGVSGIAIDRDDVRAHGKDERVRIAAYDDGVEFYYRFLKVLTKS